MRGASFRRQLGHVAPFATLFGLAASILVGSRDPDWGVWLASAPAVLVPLATRTETAVLTHPIRIRIVARLSLLPGDHFRSIVRALGVGMGDAEYHLRVLLRSGLLREEKANGRSRYYLTGTGDLERNRLFARHWAYRDLRLRVLFAVRNQGAATPASVASVLGISRQLAAYHLGRLVELGFLSRKDGHYCV